MMKRLLFSVPLLIASLPAYSRGALFGWAERGGYTAISAATGAPINVQRACPGATITVRLAGSVTSASIYSDAAGTTKPNPFTATTAGYWHFYADDGDYDVLISCGTVYSYTIDSTRISGTGMGIDPRSMGAVCDGSTDDTEAVRAAVNVSGPHNVLWPNKTCKTTDTVTVSQPRVNIIGTGRQSSRNLFLPTSGGKAAWHFTTGINAVLYQNAFEDMTIYSTDTTLQKFGILATDTSMLIIEDVAIYPFTGGSSISPFNGGGSAALKLNGRECYYINRVYLYSDIPLWISDNPNSTIDSDHTHVSNMVANATGNNPVVLIDSGVNVTNMLFDGDQTWTGGGRAFYYVDTATTFSSNSISLNNIRYEQPNEQNFAFQIEHNQTLYNLTINNALWGGGSAFHGVKLRKCSGTKIRDTRINGTGIAFDVNTTLDFLVLDNVFTQAGATKSMGGLQRVDARGSVLSLAPNSQFEYWENPTGSNFANGRCSTFMDEFKCAYQGTLANGATLDIPSLGGALVLSRIEVEYKGATKWGAFTVYADNIRAAQIGSTDTAKGTTETGTGNVPGRITVFWQAAANIDLWNQLGESVIYSLRVIQR